MTDLWVVPLIDSALANQVEATARVAPTYINEKEEGTRPSHTVLFFFCDQIGAEVVGHDLVDLVGDIHGGAALEGLCGDDLQ